MCRKNQMIMLALICFGAGILVGGWIPWRFLGILTGLGLIGLGFFFCGGNRWHK